MSKKRKTAGGWHSIHYTIEMAKRSGPLPLLKGMRSKNACKTCALGMGGQKGGMVNEKGHFPEFCKKSLQAMASDMQPGISEDFFKEHSIADLQKMSPRSLEFLGRLKTPLIRRKNRDHYEVIGFDEALDIIVERLKSVDPKRSFFYFSGRSSNEAAFILGLLARSYGTNHVNNCSYYCHQASGVGLASTIGSQAGTVQLEDVDKCDLFFLVGANPASNHPRLLTSLMKLRNRGGKVVVINPIKEQGLVRFSIPSNPKSLLVGSEIASHYIQPHVGQDLAFFQALAKVVLEKEKQNTSFIEAHTNGFAAFKEGLDPYKLEDLAAQSGVALKDIYEIADLYMASQKTVFSWAMGITHQINGVDNVKGIVNLALLGGMVGKEGCGLMPLRGHSNVQGIGSMGIKPELAKEVIENLAQAGLKVPEHKGYDTMACMDAGHRGEMDFAFCLGGNLFGSNPDSAYAAESLSKVKTLVYLNTTLNTGHAHGLGEETLVLPVLARDEEEQATTQESLFSYVRLSEGGKPRHEGPRSESGIITYLARRLFGEDHPIPWRHLADHSQIRELIGKTIPEYAQIAKMDKDKKEFYVAGRKVHDFKFNTQDGRALFSPVKAPLWQKEGGLRLISARSEGQFNTVVYEEEDRYRGQSRRDIILMNVRDMDKRGFKRDEKVWVKGPAGKMRHILVRPFDIKEGAVMMYYPEVNEIIGRQLDPLSKTPAFKSVPIEVGAEKEA